mmetsp:Transcript_23535/g.66021  ORF Transcript_23535/g.66021 Transcript_23535/m.66021 type:complete len:112 (-) Transcript_23535:310-645(-)
MASGVMQGRIIEKLTRSLSPLHLEVVNESYQHNVPRGSETHFRVVIVSDKFGGLSRVRQHQLIYETLDEEMKSVHALAIQSKTPAQMAKAKEKITPAASPACLGGMKREQS